MIILQENNLKAYFIGLNEFTNKDTGEVSYNVDLKIVYGSGEKEWSKIEKIYLKKDIKEEELNEIKKLNIGQEVGINKNVVLI